MAEKCQHPTLLHRENDMTWGKIKRIIKKLIVGDTFYLSLRLPPGNTITALARLRLGRLGVGAYAYRKNRVLIMIGAIQ